MPHAKRVDDLQNLILSYHSLITIETVEEKRVLQTLKSLSLRLKIPIFEWSVVRGLTRVSDGSSVDDTQRPIRLLTYLDQHRREGLFFLKDFSNHLEDPATIRLLKEVAEKFSTHHSTLILTAETVALPQEFRHCAISYEFKLPSFKELELLVRSVVRALKAKYPIDLEVNSDQFREILKALSGIPLKQARQMIAQVILEDRKLSAKDIPEIIRKKTESIHQGGLLDFYPPEENQAELGGFENLKNWLARAEVGFSPKAKALNLNPPKGLLIVGVQGCGKSLAAKAIAHQWNLPLLKLDAGKLFDKYIGESEKNFQKAFRIAESLSPSVLWIDEIEKGLAQGGNQEDSALGKRIFGSFLTWLQEKKEPVFVVATANDLMALPPELLRKGRFDEIFFVDLPKPEERSRIFDIHLKLRNQNPESFDRQKLVAISGGYSGAEIEQAIVSSLYRSIHEKRVPDTSLIIEEIQATVPLSVSRKEDIARLRATATDRFVSVS